MVIWYKGPFSITYEDFEGDFEIIGKRERLELCLEYNYHLCL